MIHVRRNDIRLGCSLCSQARRLEARAHGQHDTPKLNLSRSRETYIIVFDLSDTRLLFVNNGCFVVNTAGSITGAYEIRSQ